MRQRTIKLLRVYEMKLKPIISNRLILRPFTLSDAQEVVNLAGDRRVSEMTLNIPYPYSLEAAQDWIALHAEQWSNKESLVLAIEKRDTEELVGTVSLVSIEGNKAEIGYWMGHPYWGNGYCTEAVNCLIRFMEYSHGINHFSAEHLASNPASGRVMIKNGMQFIASILKKDRHGNEVKIETYDRKNT